MVNRNSLPISIRGLVKKYGSFTALDNVDLEIESGEFLTLLGPSGSGKTTLLMTIAGFTRATSGEIVIGGRDISRVPPHCRDLGMVFQNYALFPHMSVAENVAYPLKRRSLTKSKIQEKVKWALDVVQLSHLGGRNPDQLSGGQKQRVALARAISFEPSILLMDEPLSALDKNLREQMQIEIRHLHERLGITTVYVTHDQREALTMSDRIAVINEGKIAQLDTPTELYNFPNNLFVAEFIGESTIVPLEIANGGYVLNGMPLRTKHELNDHRTRPHLVLRPERLAIVDENKDPSESMNFLTATMQEIVFQGESLLLQAKLGNGEIISLRIPSQREQLESLPAIGSEVTLGMHVSDTIIVEAPG